MTKQGTLVECRCALYVYPRILEYGKNICLLHMSKDISSTKREHPGMHSNRKMFHKRQVIRLVLVV